MLERQTLGWTVRVCLGLYMVCFNPLKAELNPICHLLALLGARHIFHVSGLRVKHGNERDVSVTVGNFYNRLSDIDCLMEEC